MNAYQQVDIALKAAALIANLVSLFIQFARKGK